MTMKPKEYREHLDALGMTITSARHMLKSGERTVRRFASGEAHIPFSVEALLRVMVKYKITPAEILKLAGTKPPAVGFGDRRFKDED